MDIYAFDCNDCKNQTASANWPSHDQGCAFRRCFLQGKCRERVWYIIQPNGSTTTMYTTTTVVSLRCYSLYLGPLHEKIVVSQKTSPGTYYILLNINIKTRGVDTELYILVRYI